MNSPAFDPSSIRRPDRALLTYYLLVAAMTTVAFPFVIIPLFIKHHTLRYRFDDDGVHMSWGFLFRREIYLTYRRIQDIHVTRNLFHRWLGLAAVRAGCSGRGYVSAAATSATPPFSGSNESQNATMSMRVTMSTTCPPRVIRTPLLPESKSR